MQQLVGAGATNNRFGINARKQIKGKQKRVVTSAKSSIKGLTSLVCKAKENEEDCKEMFNLKGKGYLNDEELAQLHEWEQLDTPIDSEIHDLRYFKSLDDVGRIERRKFFLKLL